MTSYGSMIDCEGTDITSLLSALGSNYPDTIASYVTGTSGVEASSADLSLIAAHCGVFRYDQTPALESFANGKADGADIESEAGTQDAAIAACKVRQGRGWWSWLYVNESNLATLRDAVSAAKLTKVQYGVANWNLSKTEAQQYLDANSDVAFVQWASPSSNPGTICPGTSKTLAELNVDLNVTRGGWFVKASNTSPTVTTTGLVVLDDFTTLKVTTTDKKTWSV